MNKNFSNNKFKVWLAWLAVSLFLSYQYVLRVLPNVIMPYLQSHYHMSASNFGQFSGIYYIGYTLMHIPLGIMLDFIGPRLVVSTCILLVTAGLIPLIYSDSWALTSAGRLLIGIASSAAILGTFKIISMGFASKKFPFMLGLSVTLGFLGASYGGSLVNYYANTIGLQSTLEYLIYIGIALAVLSFFSLPNYRTQVNKNTLKEIIELFSHGKWIYIALLGGLMVGPVEGFADGWATTFLRIIYPYLNPHLFTLLPSILLLGLAIGAPILGYIAEKTEAYYTLIIISGVSMCIAFVMMFIGLDSTLLLFAIFITIGFFSSYQTLVIYKSCTLAPEKFAGLTTACANMIIMVFGYFFHSVIGEAIQYGSIDGYTAKSLIRGISIIPICLSVASIAFMYTAIQESKQKNK